MYPYTNGSMVTSGTSCLNLFLHVEALSVKDFFVTCLRGHSVKMTMLDRFESGSSFSFSSTKVVGTKSYGHVKSTTAAV